MHYTITKAQIEQVISVLDTHIGHYTEDMDSESAIDMLQGLLAQPEQSMYRCADCKTPLMHGYTCGNCDSFAAEEIEATHPAPFVPITADDVHGDVVVNLWRIGVLTSTGTQGKEIVAKVVNAWGAKK